MAESSRSGGKGGPRSGSRPAAPKLSPVPERAKSADPSGPEIKVAYTAATKDTLAAIAEELASERVGAHASSSPPPRADRSRREPSARPSARPPAKPAAGSPPSDPRPNFTTLDYGDRISNAPGAVAPPRPTAPSRRPPLPPSRSAPKASEPPPRAQLSSGVNIERPPQVAISNLDHPEDVLAGLHLESEAPTGVRERRRTADFKDRPRIRDTSPEVITIEERPVGRETLAAIAEEIARENRDVQFSDPGLSGSIPDGVISPLRRRAESERPPPAERAGERPASSRPTHDERSASRSPSARPASGISAEGQLEVLEMVTFVVRGDDLARLSSEQARREFVGERLMHRLPIRSLDEVDRIDVTPWTVRGTVILRVWCRVSG